MKIDIICPLYRATDYIDGLHESLLMQKKVKINSINYIVTKCNDCIEEKLRELGAKYTTVTSDEFSHSLTREKVAMDCQGDILVFITQDVIIEDQLWLYKLTNCIVTGECEASYSRQLCKNNSIEKYTREKNYPDYDILKDKSSIETMGLNAFFFSDAASAVNEEIFKKLNGYDGKNLPTNEDMYLAYKLITKGYRIKYCSQAEVIHSHDFNCKETYKRYKLFGQFFKMESYINNYGTNAKGAGMASYILKRALQERNIKVLVKFVPNMISRFIGMKVGQRVKI